MYQSMMWIPTLRKLKQLGMIFDEGRRGSPSSEFRVFQHIKREAYIRFDAPNTRFSQTACELVDGAFIS